MDTTLAGFEEGSVVTLNADGTSTIVFPDGTTVTLKAGYLRGAGEAADAEDRRAAEQA